MTLTVIIRDDGPMIHCGDSPTHRTVQIELTAEQERKVKSFGTYEAISKCWIEPIIPDESGERAGKGDGKP